MLQHVYNWIPWPAQIRQFRQTHFSRVDWTYKTQVKGYQSVCCWFFLIAIFSQNPNSVLTTPNRNKQYHGDGFFFGPGRCRWEEHCWEDDPALHIFARGDEICKYFGECLARVQEWASAGGWGCSRSPPATRRLSGVAWIANPPSRFPVAQLQNLPGGAFATRVGAFISALEYWILRKYLSDEN